jgi:hypothetical protein
MNLSNEELLSIIEKNDENNLIKASKELLLRNVVGVQDRLLDILKNTQNNVIRNELALLLSDAKNPKLFEVIVDLLKNSKTSNSRGTLLYALGGYNCSSILSLLVDFVISGNFEVSNQAYNLITEINSNIQESVWTECKNKIENALRNNASKNMELLKELLNIFNDN